MRSAIPVMLAALCAMPGLGAENFILKSAKTGRAYGPFEFRDGAPVAIGQAEFVVVRAPATVFAAAGRVTCREKTLEVRAALAVWSPAMRQMQIHLFPFVLSADEQKGLLEGTLSIEQVKQAHPPPDAQAWPYRPMAFLYVTFRGDAPVCGANAVRQTTLGVWDWDRPGSQAFAADLAISEWSAPVQPATGQRLRCRLRAGPGGSAQADLRVDAPIVVR